MKQKFEQDANEATGLNVYKINLGRVAYPRPKLAVSSPLKIGCIWGSAAFADVTLNPAVAKCLVYICLTKENGKIELSLSHPFVNIRPCPEFA